MAANMELCENCQIREGLKRCARCKLACYCSRECQKKHWKAGHKTNCVDVNKQGKGLKEKTHNEIQ